MKTLYALSLVLLLAAVAFAGAVISLGKVTVATSGVPVKLNATSLTVRSVMVQADTANTGTYMTLKDSAGNTICKFAKGQSCSPPVPPSGVDLSTLQLDSDTNGDGAFASYGREF